MAVMEYFKRSYPSPSTHPQVLMITPEFLTAISVTRKGLQSLSTFFVGLHLLVYIFCKIADLHLEQFYVV